MSTELLHAVKRLREGGLVAFPTETVYGLGANALDERAVAEIYAVKNRPQFNPLIVHVPDAAAAQTHTQWNAQAEVLTQAFWPGPLTMVLPRRADCRIALLASAGLETLAVRAPAHPLAQALLTASGLPLAAPSANRSGRISPTRASHVHEELGDALMVLDGGPCAVGLESTVIDIHGDTPTLLRAGAISQADLERVLGCAVRMHAEEGALHSPGMLKTHYAPALPLRLNAAHAGAGEALLAFGPCRHATLNLSEKADLTEAAANLFAHLRALDRPEFRAIAVMPVPMDGIGAAINDRLQRAAAR